MSKTQYVDTDDFKYFEEFNVPMHARWGACDIGVIYKDNVYEWKDVRKITKFSGPKSPNARAFFKIEINNKTLDLCYTFEDYERALSVFDFISSNISNNEIETFNKETAKSPSFNDTYINKTPEDLWNYSINNNLCMPTMKKTSLANYKIGLESLYQDEEVLFCFEGIQDFISLTNHSNFFAYIFTNKRILLAQDYMFAKNVMSVSYDNVNDVTISTIMMMSTITIDTLKQVIRIGVNKQVGQNIINGIHNVLNKVRGGLTKSNNQQQVISSADEILKFKQLLDAGIITQEEFDAKKKQLLGL